MGSGNMRKPCHDIRKIQGVRLRCTFPSGLQRQLYTQNEKGRGEPLPSNGYQKMKLNV